MAAELGAKALAEVEQEVRQEARCSLNTDAWRKELRGRDIIKRFAGTHGGGISYEQVRNLIVARMRDDNHQPEGMRNVLDNIAPSDRS